MLFNELHQGGIRALLDWDDTLFDGMVLPDDINDDDTKKLIVDDIILRHGDTPLFIPEPTVMKYYITSWSTRMLPVFTRMYAACMAEYNPIENYDRQEDRTDTIGNTRTLDTSTATTGTNTTEDSVSAENVTTFSPDTKTVETPDLNVADSGTISDDGSVVVDSHIHGNIGVTTSQQMLESELQLVPKLDMIRIISDSWAAEFCLAVY